MAPVFASTPSQPSFLSFSDHLHSCRQALTGLRKAVLAIGFALLLVSGLLPGRALAQSMVTGKVTDGTAPVGWANVVLFGLDGKLVAAAVSREDGAFALEAASGTYQLKVSFLGFADHEQKVLVKGATPVAPIILHPNAATLQDVLVVGRKNLVEYRPDRVVFNVENSVAAVGGDAVAAIGAAPGVLVRNNSISMLGKGSARVMVNGRLLEVSGEELVTYLKSIPASSIRSVEVITTPPANYEAGGDGGLININLKQGQANSWKNTTTLAYEQNTYAAYSLRNNLLYNKNRLRLTLSAGGKLGHTNVRQTLTTHYPTGPWELGYTARQRADNASGRLALDYDLTPRTSLGLQYAGSYTTPDSHDHTQINIFNPGQTLDSLLVNTGARRLTTASHAYNAHVVTVLDTLQRKLSVDADYFSYESTIDNAFVAESFSPEREFLGTNLRARTISGQQVQAFSAKADVEHPLKWAKLSYGTKISLIDSKSGLQYHTTQAETPVLDPGQSNTFAYREQTQAAYVSGTRSITSKWSLQLGLRLENTHTRGYSTTLSQLNTNQYLKLFPTAYVSYAPTENHSAQATYGRRVNRPGFGLLNPFRSYINSTSYSEGNPFLRPSFADNLEVTYTYKGAFRTNAFVSRTTGGFGPVFTSNPASKTLVISRQNYYNEYAYGVGETYTATVTAWWQTQSLLYVLASNSRFVLDVQAAPVNTPQLYASTSNTFSVSQSTKLQVDYIYGSPTARGLFKTGYVSGLNLACTQSLFHNRVQATVLLNDVFNTAYLKDYTSTVNGIRQVYSENNSSRFFRFSLTYDFGNGDVKVKPRDFGNDEERKRTN